jgi:hypothetical protein
MGNITLLSVTEAAPTEAIMFWKTKQVVFVFYCNTKVHHPFVMLCKYEQNESKMLKLKTLET